MIDIKREEVLPLTVAAVRLPQRPSGKRLHVATLYRWATRGRLGVRLEVLRVGGQTCTSMEALQRFFDRLTALQAKEPPPPARRPSANAAATDRELERHGF